MKFQLKFDNTELKLNYFTIVYFYFIISIIDENLIDSTYIGVLFSI